MNKALDLSIEYFNIPQELSHHADGSTMTLMDEGIIKIKAFSELLGIHEGCIQQTIKYAELNMRFLFLASLVNKETQQEALEIYLTNIRELFTKKT